MPASTPPSTGQVSHARTPPPQSRGEPPLQVTEQVPFPAQVTAHRALQVTVHVKPIVAPQFTDEPRPACSVQFACASHWAARGPDVVASHVAPLSHVRLPSSIVLVQTAPLVHRVFARSPELKEHAPPRQTKSQPSVHEHWSTVQEHPVPFMHNACASAGAAARLISMTRERATQRGSSRTQEHDTANASASGVCSGSARFPSEEPPVPVVNRPGSPTIPTVTPSSPAQPAVPVTPSTPATPVAPAAPSRFDGTVTRLKGKAVELVMDQVADEHALSKGVSFGLAQGNVKVAEKLALPGTDTFKDLVGADSRRAAHAQSNPDAVWVATRVMAGASAGVPLGAGASLGFSGSVEVTSVMAHEVKGARDVPAALAAQGKSLVLPLDAEALQSMKAAPGSEWMVRGQVAASAGIGVGRGVTFGTDVIGGSATVGVNAGVSATDVYTKHVKVLDGSRVFVQVGKQDTDTASASVGVNVGLDLNGGGAVGNLAAKEVEKRTRISASVSGSTSRGEKLLGAAVLDLSTPAGREAYDYLLRSSPGDAAAFIKSQNLGVQYAETSRTTATGVNFQLGSSSLLATSTVKGTTNGTLEEPGSTTLLTQADYGRNVGGFFARLTVGEERSVSVRAGSVTRNGTTQQAVAVSLAVKDPKLTGEELQQLQRFGAAMGAPLDGLPPVQANLGKGEYQVTVALTGDDVAQLRQRSEDDLRLAFANAHREISGGSALPPWHSEKAVFDWYKGRLSDANLGSDPNAKQAAEAEYKQQFGRDLLKDIDSQQAIDAIVKQVGAARGKPLGEWGKVLESLGKQPSVDVRASTLALRRLATADVVSLSVTAGGKTVTAQPQVAAPPTIADLTGPLLNAPV